MSDFTNPKILTQDISIPGISNKQTFDISKYSVKYKKFDADDVADMIELQKIETECLRGDKIILLSRNTFTFMSQYFLVVSYLEKD